MAFGAQRGDQQIGLLANGGAAGRDRVIARRQRPQQTGQLFGGQLPRRGFQQIDDLTALRPLSRQRRAAHRRHMIAHLLRGQRGDVVAVD